MEAEVLKKACPYCREFMDGEATVCPHCQRAVTVDDKIGCGYSFLAFFLPVAGLIFGIIFAARPETAPKGKKLIMLSLMFQVVYIVLAMILSTAVH